MTAWTLVFAAAIGCADTSWRQEEGVYVSLVRKDSVQTWHNRLTTEDYHLVVTSEPVFASKAASFVGTDSDHDLWIVELAPGTALEQRNKLPGEVLRLGDFAVVRMLGGKDPHTVLGDHKIYAEKIRRVAQSYPAPSLEPGAMALLQGAAAADRDLNQEMFSGGLEADEAWLRDRLSELSGAVPVTLNGREERITERRSANGRTLARAWMRQQYEALGFTVTEEAYGSALSQGVNLIAEKAGADTSKYLVLSSHYDSVGNAGADDDGAGTVSALAIARALAGSPLKYNLRVVAFDQEENGLVGSAAYARTLNGNGGFAGLIGVINIEMTGYDADGDGAFHAIHCNENTSSELSGFLNRVVARDPLGLKIEQACTNRSDHASFWRYNKPAIVVSQNFFGGDSNPCYHASCDKVDKVNFDYMQRLTTALMRAVADMML
jgi:hypothetical protein